MHWDEEAEMNRKQEDENRKSPLQGKKEKERERRRDREREETEKGLSPLSLAYGIENRSCKIHQGCVSIPL